MIPHIPSHKRFDGVDYKYHGQHTTKAAAIRAARKLRADGLEARVQRRKYIRGDPFVYYVVWYYGGPTRTAIKKYGKQG
jgi:hypothetical protein